MKSMCSGHKVAAALVLVGALNWGLMGAFGFNLINSVLGGMPTAERAAYVLVGLAAVLILLAGKCKKCGNGPCNCGEGHVCGAEKSNAEEEKKM
jgi:uncharacterized protein